MKLLCVTLKTKFFFFLFVLYYHQLPPYLKHTRARTHTHSLDFPDFTWVLFLMKSSENSSRVNWTIKAKCLLTLYFKKGQQDHKWLREFGDENELLNGLLTLVFTDKTISKVFAPQLYFEVKIMAFH